MKILLIGHSIIDHFIDEEEKVKPGGIYYSALSLCSIKKPVDELFLLTSWNEKTFHLFEKVYSKTRIDFSNEVQVMPEVILDISNSEDRKEVYKNISVSLSTEKLTNLYLFDGLLINMITGFDITIGQLQELRAGYEGLIYFDLHTLSRGIDENMNRYFRPVPDVESWLKNIDILQCNESELKTIIEYNNEIESAEKILRLGPKILLITKGAKGAAAYFLKNNLLKEINQNAVQVNYINKVGCGDIFGAVFFYFYISTNDIELSLKKAVEAGSIAAQRNDFHLNPEFIFND